MVIDDTASIQRVNYATFSHVKSLLRLSKTVLQRNLSGKSSILFTSNSGMYVICSIVYSLLFFSVPSQCKYNVCSLCIVTARRCQENQRVQQRALNDWKVITVLFEVFLIKLTMKNVSFLHWKTRMNNFKQGKVVLY